MEIHPFLEWCIDHWGFVAFIIGLFIQVTPAIKFNPFTALFSLIGKWVNGEVLKEMIEIKNRLDQQRRSIDENEMDRIRWEVLDFANACRNHIKHTKDEFQHIIALNKKYHDLLDKYDEENGVFDVEYAYILELYHECQRANSFL